MKIVKNFLITTILILFLVLQNCNYLGYKQAKDTYDDTIKLYFMLLAIIQFQEASSLANCLNKAVIYKSTDTYDSSTSYYCVDSFYGTTACNYTLAGYDSKAITSSCTDIGFDSSMGYSSTGTYSIYSCATYTSGTDTCNSTITSAFSDNGLNLLDRK